MAEREEAVENPRDASQRPVTEHLGAVFALAASVSVIVSFVYDWGFFSTLGIGFAQAPTAISDHLRSWLIWLPLVITPVLILLAHELLMSRLERGLTDEEIVESLPIRLTPMTATCWAPPLSRVKLGIGWSRGVARDAEQ